MPTNAQRLSAALITAGLFIGGAWAASTLQAAPVPTVASSTGTASDDGVTVTLHGTRNATGELVVIVFDTAAGFDAMDPYKAAGLLTLPARPHPQRVDFPDLTDGPYAVVVFHDENGDDDLNLTKDGLPLEGYAVSGMNDLYDYPVFDQSLIDPATPTDLTLFYWPIPKGS